MIYCVRIDKGIESDVLWRKCRLTASGDGKNVAQMSKVYNRQLEWPQS